MKSMVMVMPQLIESDYCADGEDGDRSFQRPSPYCALVGGRAEEKPRNCCQEPDEASDSNLRNVIGQKCLRPYYCLLTVETCFLCNPNPSYVILILILCPNPNPDHLAQCPLCWKTGARDFRIHSGKVLGSMSLEFVSP